MIRAIGYVDALPAAATYYAKFRDRLSPTEDGAPTRALPLTDDVDWKSARNLIARVQALVTTETEIAGSLVFGLDSGGVTQWSREEGEAPIDRFVVPLSVGPGVVLHAGGGAVQLTVGHVLHFNPRNFHCATNFGPVMAVALTVDLKPCS